MNGLSAAIAVEYIDHGFEKQYYGMRRFLLFFTGMAVYFFLMSVFHYEFLLEALAGLCHGAVLACYGMLALKGKKTDIVILSLIWILIAVFSTYLMFGIFDLMTGKELEQLSDREGAPPVYFTLAAGALKFSMGRAVLALYNKERQKRKREEDWMIAGTFLLLFMMVYCVFYLEMGELKQESRYDLSMLLLAGMTLTVVLLSIFYHRLERYRREKLEMEYQKKSREKQEEQIRDLYQISREVNRMRHDMKGKLYVLYCLTKKEKYKETAEYIERMQTELRKYPELPQDTGNEGLNAALMKTIPECRERKIHFRYVIMGRPEHMDAMDMGNLLYNLLANGMEASEKAETERELELIVRSETGIIEIEVENSIRESVLQENPEMKSKKKEKKLHGFGMVSIREIVDKYHGEYVCWEEDKRLIQRICLYRNAG